MECCETVDIQSREYKNIDVWLMLAGKDKRLGQTWWAI